MPCGDGRLPHLGEDGRHSAGDVTLTTTYTYDPPSSTLVSAMTLQRGEERAERVARHRVMTCREIVGILDRGGFDVVEIAGGPQSEPFTVGSPRCLITARRRSP